MCFPESVVYWSMKFPTKLDSLTVLIFQTVSKKNLRSCMLIFLSNNFSIMVGNGVG